MNFGPKNLPKSWSPQSSASALCCKGSQKFSRQYADDKGYLNGGASLANYSFMATGNPSIGKNRQSPTDDEQ